MAVGVAVMHPTLYCSANATCFAVVAKWYALGGIWPAAWVFINAQIAAPFTWPAGVAIATVLGVAVAFLFFSAFAIFLPLYWFLATSLCGWYNTVIY